MAPSAKGDWGDRAHQNYAGDIRWRLILRSLKKQLLRAHHIRSLKKPGLRSDCLKHVSSKQFALRH